MFTGFSALMKKEKKPKLTSLDYEKKILETQGFVINEDIFVYDVDLPNTKGHIHTIETGRENLQKLVLIHGYGATGVFYWKIMKQLKDKFHIYSIDVFGKGNSSRPPFKNFSYDGACNFFCDAIQEWIEILKIEDFYIMGHSFGGYVTVQLLRLKNLSIKHCFLLSPAGFTFKSKEEVRESFKTSGMNKSFLHVASFVFYLIEDWKFTPYQLMNLTGKKKTIAKFFKGARLKLLEEESFLFGNYYYLIQTKPVSGDKALPVFLYYGRYSKQPLVDQIAVMKKDDKLPPLTVVYGETDWMDKDHSRKISEERELGLDIRILPGCGHQIIFQNPEGLAELICEQAGMSFEPVVVDTEDIISTRKILEGTKFKKI